MLHLFPYEMGTCMDDYGNLINLSMEAWDNAWHWWYGYGFYDCNHWPIQEHMGHI